MQKICKLTGFDLGCFTEKEILKEATRKFGNTYLTINDALIQVENFNQDGVQPAGQHDTIPHSKIYSIEPWLPKSGIYKVDENFIYLRRTPKRQWLKSFSLYENYTFTEFTSKPIEKINITKLYYESLVKDHTISHDRQWLFYANQLVYKYHVVATVTQMLEIQVSDAKFFQEVYDKWHRQYKVTTISTPQNQKQDES